MGQFKLGLVFVVVDSSNIAIEYTAYNQAYIKFFSLREQSNVSSCTYGLGFLFLFNRANNYLFCNNIILNDGAANIEDELWSKVNPPFQSLFVSAAVYLIQHWAHTIIP